MNVTITFSQFHFAPAERFWALRQMGTFGNALRDVGGLRFWRLLGTGKRFGGVEPDFGRYALLTVWESEAHARRARVEHSAIGRYGLKAERIVTHRLATLRATGSWDGDTPFRGGEQAPAGCRIAVLTRATVRISRQLAFWRHAAPVDAEIAAAPGLIEAVSIGELPILRSGTFSIWRDAAAIAAFVERPAHRLAMRARSQKGFYREELFARFAVLSSELETVT